MALLFFAEATFSKSLIFPVEVSRWSFGEAQKAFLVRYADDFVLVFASARDAQRVMAVLAKRFAKYGLTVHRQKTRVLDFPRPQPQQHAGKGGESFQFLGFTHHWGRSRKGRWVVQRKTASQRMSRALKAVAQWCQESRHWALVEQHQGLSRKLRGHFAYYGITGNVRALKRFHHQVATYGDLYTGTQAETPDTAKREPTGRAPAPYPDRRFTVDFAAPCRWSPSPLRVARGCLSAAHGILARHRLRPIRERSLLGSKRGGWCFGETQPAAGVLAAICSPWGCCRLPSPTGCT